MTEIPQVENIEVKIAAVDQWAVGLKEAPLLWNLDRSLLHDVLTEFGANLNISPELQASLSKEHYTNDSRAEAMRAVWGEKFKDYKDWTNVFIEEYERETKKVLKGLEKTGHKNSGMIGFLGELTAYAVGNDETYPFMDFYTRMNARVINGSLREAGYPEKELRAHIVVPGYNVVEYVFPGKDQTINSPLPFAPSGFPPSFPVSALDKMKSWK